MPSYLRQRSGSWLSVMTIKSVPSIDYRVVAHRLERDYLPDANLSKATWQSASRLTLVDTENPQRSHPGAKTEASVRWSPEHLYIAFWCHYTELNLYLGEDAGQERWELWNRDVAEVFLTPFPESLIAIGNSKLRQTTCGLTSRLKNSRRFAWMPAGTPVSHMPVSLTRGRNSGVVRCESRRCRWVFGRLSVAWNGASISTGVMAWATTASAGSWHGARRFS